jgi:5-methyltetrahydropteroyltriglutamate--homocysteine methyltransferase
MTTQFRADQVGSLLRPPGLLEARQARARGELALSPQCGFASVAAGNLLSPEDQWRKLELVVDTARSVWG